MEERSEKNTNDEFGNRKYPYSKQKTEREFESEELIQREIRYILMSKLPRRSAPPELKQKILKKIRKN